MLPRPPWLWCPSVSDMRPYGRVPRRARGAPDDDTLPALRRLHLWAGGLHAVTAFAVTVVAAVFVDRGRAPLYLQLYGRQTADSQFYVSESFPLLCLPAVFSALAAVDHLATCYVVPGFWARELAQGRQPMRWLEYFFSAAVMNVLIAMLTGVPELTSLIGVAALTSMTMVYGYWYELAAPGRDQLRVLWAGCWPYMIVWAYIFFQFFGNLALQSAPSWVYLVVLLLFALESLFAVQLWRPLEPQDRDRGFVWLSLLAKQALVWLTVGGCLSY